jgi:hypothetical protein
MDGRRPPAGQRSKKTPYRRLQNRRVRAKVRRISKRFVYHGIERGDTPDKVAPYQARSGLLRPGQQECGGKPGGDFRRNRSKLHGKPTPSSTEICTSEHDARADDTDTNFACARDRQD